MNRVLLLLISVVLLWTAEVSAHAVFLGSDPADGAQLSQAPPSAILRFNEPVSPIAVRLLDADGKPVGGVGQTIASDSEVRLPLPAELPNGYYVLSFRVISLDSHPVAASIVFSVGTSSAGAAEAEALRRRLEPGDAARLPAYLNLTLHYLSLLFAAGMALFIALFRLPDTLLRTSETAMRRAAGLGVVTAFLAIGLGGAKIAGVGIAELATLKIWLIGAEATLGASGMVAILALLGLLLASYLADRSARVALSAAAGLLAIASLAFTGHAVQAKPTWVTLPALVLHAAMACFWFGALWPLMCALRAAPEAAAGLLEQFSKSAVFSMALLVIAAIALAVFQVVSLGAFVTTDYGLILLAKMALVATILALAAANKWRLVPAIRRGEARARRQLRMTIGIEMALGVMVIALTAALGLTPPPRALGEAAATSDPHAAHQAPAARPAMFVTRTRAGDIDMTTTVTPATPGANAVVLTFRKSDGTPLDPQEVSIEIAKPESGIEAIARKTNRVEAGKYQFTTSDLVIVGTWELRVAVLIDDFTRRDIVARVPIERPGTGIARTRPLERRNVAYGALAIARGQTVYEQNCAGCHGVEGYGNGVAAGALTRRPANLTSDHLFHHGDDMLFDWVSNGIADTPMPAFAGLLTENERWDVLHFLRAQAEAEQTNTMAADVLPWRPLVAPDFQFRIAPAAPETLIEQRGATAVLLVFYRPNATVRLAQLHAAQNALAASGLRIIAIPMPAGDTNPPSPASEASRIGAEPNDQAVAAYRLFRRVLSVEAILDIPDHMEFLIDRQGYLRARWFPGEWDGWDDLTRLTAQVETLAREPAGAPAPNIHIPLK